MSSSTWAAIIEAGTASRGRINEQSLRAGLISEALSIPGYRVKAVLSQMEKKTAL